MGKRTCVFAFGNQKGGVGKSTLTTVFGNYLHQVHGERYSFQAVDGDDLQRTLFKIRLRDLGLNREDYPSEESLNAAVYDLEKEYGLYHILRESSASIKDSFVDRYNGSLDFLAVDLPGNLMQEGVMDCYLPVDVLFVPCNQNFLEIDSTKEFLKYYQLIDGLRTDIGFTPADKYMVISKHDRKLSFDRDQFASNFPVPVLDNIFPLASAAHGRDINSLLKFKKNDKDVDTEKLLVELFGIIEKKYQELNS